MNFGLSKWSKLLLGLAVAASIVALAGDQALASNMGFKINKVISPKSVNANVGQNLVAIPYQNPYANAGQLCAALGLTSGFAKVIQNNAQTGASLSFTCGGATPYTLRPREGFKVIEQPTAAGGILVGSHQSNPPGSVTLYASSANINVGQNLYNVPYHTTNVTAADVCVDLGLPNGSTKVIRNNAATGSSSSFTCGGATPYSIVLGEALLINSIPTGTPPITPGAGHPAHF